MGMCHECAIGCAYKSNNLKRDLYVNAISQNHRGEEGTGFCVDVGETFMISKSTGLVRNAFPEMYKTDFKAHTGFIHNRYSTAGSSTKGNLQPIKVGNIAVGHNGTLANTEVLRKRYANDYDLKTETDTELIGCIFDAAGGDLLEGAKRCFDECEGAYNLVVMNSDGDMAMLRDPWAIHPLFVAYLGEELGDGGTVYGASEDCAFSALGIYDETKRKEVRAGEAIIFRKNGDIERHLIRPGEKLWRCFFEPIYFMSFGSTHKGKLVSDIRIELGEIGGNKLIRKGIKGDIVAIMRDSGADYSEGCHKVLNIPIVDGYCRCRYVGRTYISPEGKGENIPEVINFTRMEKAVLKNPPIPSRIKDKIVIIPDDSKVRGNTSKGTNTEMFKAGVKEIHELVIAPPIKYPCFLGMDHAKRKNLVAAPFGTLEEAEVGVSKRTGSTTTTYCNKDDLKPVLNDEDDHCWGCIDGKYPFELPDKFLELMKL